MGTRWTKERKAKYMATIRAKRAQVVVKDHEHERRNHNHDELIHLTAELLRLLPDEKLIEMVKTQSR